MTEKDKWVTATPDQLYDMATVLINGRDKRIAELEKQVEQLREALKEAAFIAKTFIDGYEDLANSVGVFEAEKASIKTARKQLKALEQTK